MPPWQTTNKKPARHPPHLPCRRGGAAALPIFSIKASAQQTLNVTIAASHPVQNFWVAMMKNVFQPEVEKHCATTATRSASTGARPMAARS